jgi:hypothetical protein
MAAPFRFAHTFLWITLGIICIHSNSTVLTLLLLVDAYTSTGRCCERGSRAFSCPSRSLCHEAGTQGISFYFKMGVLLRHCGAGVSYDQGANNFVTVYYACRAGVWAQRGRPSIPKCHASGLCLLVRSAACHHIFLKSRVLVFSKARQCAQRTAARESLRQHRTAGLTSPAFHACGSASPVPVRCFNRNSVSRVIGPGAFAHLL